MPGEPCCWWLTLLVFALFGALALLIETPLEQLQLVAPGLVALPLFALFACLNGQAVPLALPTDGAKAASGETRMIGVMLVAFVRARWPATE